jgi:surface protein
MKIKGSMHGAFAGMENLKSISGFEYIDTSELTDVSYMFKDCKSLASINLDDFETKSLKNAEGMFMGCVGLKQLDLSDFNLNNATNLSYLFSGCNSLNELVLPKMQNVKTLANCFEGVGSCSDYNAQITGTLNTPYLEDASYMFKNTRLYDYTVAESMETSNLINAEGMFYDCAISEINLTKWKTEKLQNVSKMFYSDSALSSINISGWDANLIDDCESMFYKCTSLGSIDLGWTNVSNITHLASMFKNCFHIRSIDLSCFDQAHMGDTTEMFENCEELTTIYGTGFKADVSDRMFLDCYELKGVKKYSKEAVTIEMANTEGYMTKNK